MSVVDIKNWMILLAWLILFPREAQAARAGLVVMETDVYESPALISRVLGKVHRGDAVEASNVPLQGFYKVKTAAGVLGYLPMEYLEFKAPAAASSGSGPGPGGLGLIVKAKSRTDASSWRSWVRLAAQGGYSVFKNKDLNDVFNTTGVSGGATFSSVDLSVLLTTNFHLVFRGEWISKRVFATVAGVGTKYQLDTWSYPLMGGLAIAFPVVPQFTLEGQVVAGMGYSTYFTSAVEGSSTRYGSIAPFSLLALGRISVRPVKNLGLFAEGGYRILKTSATAPREIGGGAEIFKKDGEYRQLAVDLSGIGFSGGVSIYF